MKVRNNGPDRYVLGMHFPEGVVVTIADDIDPNKKAWIANEFEVVTDEDERLEVVSPIEVAAEDGEQPAPIDVPQDGADEHPQPRRKARRRVFGE